jgi:hypothetical protein
VALVGICASASLAQAVPRNFWGVVPQGSLNLEQFQRLRSGGAESVRLPVGWGSVQPVQGGPYDWSGLDTQVEQAARSGLDLLPFLSGAPTWAVPSAFVPATNHGAKAPAHLPVSGVGRGGWINFLKAAVARYGPNGVFWTTHPTLPVHPIRTWQIWNEENFKYFVARPNPVEYGQLVKISSAAIKSVDPGATIVLGGMFALPQEGLKTKQRPRQAYFATEFLELMYKGTPGIKTAFQGVALHPYTARYQLLTPEIEEVRDTLKASHDAGKGLWITELGWSSEAPSPGDVFAKGPSGQAAQLKGALSLLRKKQRAWKIQRVYWFSVDDQPHSCNFCDGSGLFGEGFVPKKSWYAFAQLTGGTP